MFQRTFNDPAPVCALLGSVAPQADKTVSVSALCRPAAPALSWSEIEPAAWLNEVRSTREWSLSDKLRFLILG